MKTLLALIFTLTATLANSAPTTLPYAIKDSVTVGGVTFTDTANLKVLTCYNSGTWCSARVPGVLSGYTVPVGKKYTIYAIFHTSANSTSGSRLSYSDNDLGYGTATPTITNEVYYGNTISFLTIPSNIAFDYARALKFSVPAGKYININSAGSGGGSTLIYGYEENP